MLTILLLHSVHMVHSWMIYGLEGRMHSRSVLWQPLDQCPIVALTINLKDRYLVGNTSCIIYKRT